MGTRRRRWWWWWTMGRSAAAVSRDETVHGGAGLAAWVLVWSGKRCGSRLHGGEPRAARQQQWELLRTARRALGRQRPVRKQLGIGIWLGQWRLVVEFEQLGFRDTAREHRLWIHQPPLMRLRKKAENWESMVSGLYIQRPLAAASS